MKMTVPCEDFYDTLCCLLKYSTGDVFSAFCQIHSANVVRTEANLRERVIGQYGGLWSDELDIRNLEPCSAV
jgi:hypothetical protein